MNSSPKKVAQLLALATCLASFSALADTAISECGFSGSRDERPTTTASCTFSQRQGYINVRIDGGEDYDFSPTGDSPGNYIDQQGNAVYRQSGLGKEGQLFKLQDNYLFVFWNPARLDCDQQALESPGQCTLLYRDISFAVQASSGSSLNQLRIQPDGLSADNAELLDEIDGSAYRAETADLDSNGWPEVYVFISSAGSGGYGSLVAYAVNDGKSITPIYLPPLEESPEVTTGYMGHDEFAVVESRLVRRFPIYQQGDTNSQPSGGTRQLQYRLEAGEAGWILELDRVVDY